MWEETAAKHVSLAAQLSQVAALASRWRQLELASWRGLLQRTVQRFAQGADKVSGGLRLDCNQGDDVNAVSPSVCLLLYTLVLLHWVGMMVLPPRACKACKLTAALLLPRCPGWQAWFHLYRILVSSTNAVAEVSVVVEQFVQVSSAPVVYMYGSLSSDLA